jgi:uncharacterized protein YcgI (DUF1989 family)
MRNNTVRIPPKTGTAFSLGTGQTLTISAVDGGQVVDLFCFAAGSHTESLSAGHTTDYNETLFLSTEHILYSNQSRPMLTLLEDPAGPHIMLYAPCSQKMYEKSYGITDPHPNCLDNFTGSLAKYGIQSHQVGIPLNIFMQIEIQPDGTIQIKPPRAKAGDYLILRAEMELIVALSACPAGLCNDFSWSAVDVAIT